MPDARPLTSPAPLRRGRALAWLVLAAIIYLLALVYLDRDKQVLARLSELAVPLCACMALTLVSYLLRYQRWNLVLQAQGYKTKWRPGITAYLAGFAFTASPGKAGELLRIRYFSLFGVPAQTTLTTFLYERTLDLLVITLFAVGAAKLTPIFGVFVALVLSMVASLCLVASWPWLQQCALKVIGRLPGTRTRCSANFLLAAATALHPLFRPGITVSSTLYGALAWLLAAAAFALLCQAAGITLPWHYALAIYPLAMLIGALSFIPGGVGTTEAAIVFMLKACGADLDAALAVAIGIRLTSLWLAVLVGMLATASLEIHRPV